MRTHNYGQITQFKNQGGGGKIDIPIHFTKDHRWICHRFASPSMGNGNWGSEIIVLVDNFGETYHFSEQDSGNGYTMTLTSYYDKDLRVRAGNYRVYDGCVCICYEDRHDAFTDDFIDILKATPGIGLGSRKEIDNYVKTLVEKNKKVNIYNSRDNLDVIEIKRSKEKLDYKVAALMEENSQLKKEIEKLEDTKDKKETEIEIKEMIKHSKPQTLLEENYAYDTSYEQGYEQGQIDYRYDPSYSDDLDIYMYEYKQNEPTKYNGYEVYGSWDNWEKPYEIMDWIEFIEENYVAWIIQIPKKYVKLGKKYLYKVKKDGDWIEPTENELRMKDEKGNWNNVLFIH